MDTYKTRHIQFKELIKVNNWTTKIYTISKTNEFKNKIYYKNVIDKLPEWLNMENSFNATNDKIAYLILHEGSEGLFSIINWWVGKNMLNTNIFFTNHEETNIFKMISGDGLAPCIWELEIINYERISWIKNVLKKAPNPDYKTYLEDSITCEL